MGLTRSKNLSAAKKTADGWFSKYIRIRDANKNGMCRCITCDTVKHWKEMDCGHFQSRRYMATRYNEFNANSQCQACNQFGAGEQFRHGKEIDAKFGKGTSESMEKIARTHEKLSKIQVMEIAREYKRKAEEFAKAKGIRI